ncbi:anti-sigma factor antagonist [Roseovarius faecimaris]|uniref:Anti-sigma factor antagonist n=1 Tax=Roseovarius faecimaris TaxID=2494550 RepID=A0A6I6IV55_9RHOB|nr:STAS domain-containing protein [Roseovarius faecimaris]QGX99541.1 anti-sigma factor antagonist [Roseovarius faecimaris]
MDLQNTVEGKINIITINAARIDASIAIQFKDAMRAATTAPTDRVILDMRQVNFVDSSGLGAIVAAMKGLGRDTRLELAGLTPDVDKVFRLTRMDTVFDIHPDLAAATSAKRAG